MKKKEKKKHKQTQKNTRNGVRKISLELKYAQNQRYITKCECK
jgi:hypothetical protein